MSYSETISFLYSRLPMYQRTGKAAYKADLNTTIALCERLGNPEAAYPSVHIAGTNGKGSTASLVASMLQEAGYRVGLFTSPHLKDFRERIRINGEMISEETVVDFVATQRRLLEDLSPSFFEWTAGLAFHHFAKQVVDIAVFEVGLGGRLDSTNVVRSIVSCITSIGMDHAELLGDTEEKIAKEKAGIIRNGVPIVIPEGMKTGVREVIRTVASEKQAPLIEEGPLAHPTARGSHQHRNMGCAYGIVRQLRLQGYSISDAHIALGIERIKDNTGIRGRWELITEDPRTIADVAHNVDGIQAMLNNLSFERYASLHVVFGAVNDKDLSPVLQLMPAEGEYYFAKAEIPRGLPAEELLEQAVEHGLRGRAFDSVHNALQAAQSAAKDNDLVLITGSVFVVAECL